MLETTPHGGDLVAYAKMLGVQQQALLDFSANVNPLGIHPHIKQAIIGAIDSSHQYPDPSCTELRTQLAAHHNLSADKIVCGNGGADMIFRAVFAQKPKKVLIVSPTFSEYEKAVLAVGGTVAYFALSEENGFLLTEAILASLQPDIEMLFICNPNNPTGVLYPRSLLEAIATHCLKQGIRLFIDECFMDFTEASTQYSLSQCLDTYPNLVILKAFTKMYALPGVRLGYALCADLDFIDKMQAVAQHWSVSTLAMAGGVAALRLEGYAQQVAMHTAKERAYLTAQFAQLGFITYHSRANYIFFKSDIPDLKERLAGQSIIIRSCENYHGLDKQFYRIGIKSAEDNQKLLVAVAKLRGEQNG